MKKLEPKKLSHMTELGNKVYAMSIDELDNRMKEISQQLKDLSDIGATAPEVLQEEALLIASRIMMNEDLDGSMDGDCCEGCDGHCEC